MKQSIRVAQPLIIGTILYHIGLLYQLEGSITVIVTWL